LKSITYGGPAQQRVFMGMTKRSDQQIALGRRTTRIGWIKRVCIASEVLENPFDDGRILNARDHLKLPAAAPADLNVDGKDTFEA
jgi:hypothetical protein